MDEQQLREVYEMVDGIPFSRTKKNINRDFSDGVMMAELIAHYRPKLVELHSYPAASSASKKIVNWNTLNTKVLKKLGLGLGKKEIEDIVNCVPLTIENYLYTVLKKFEAPAEEVNVRQQFRKPQPDMKNKPNLNSSNGNAPRASGQPASPDQKQTPWELKPGMMGSNETDQVLNLIEEIEEAYGQLLKLQEISKLKDEVIKNLQKKVEKMVFS